MKRRVELHGLSDDHHTALVLAHRCTRTTAKSQTLPVAEVWAQVQEMVDGLLEPHFEIEERYLLPAMEELGEQAMVGRLRAEHARLRAALASEAPTPQAVTAFGELLEQHIRYEEREVFEAVQGRLPQQTLDAIEEICRSMPRACLTPVGMKPSRG